MSCFQSSPDCSVNETSLPYSQCCASGTEHFMINDTCYVCAGENHYNVASNYPTYIHICTSHALIANAICVIHENIAVDMEPQLRLNLTCFYDTFRAQDMLLVLLGKLL